MADARVEYKRVDLQSYEARRGRRTGSGRSRPRTCERPVPAPQVAGGQQEADRVVPLLQPRAPQLHLREPHVAGDARDLGGDHLGEERPRDDLAASPHRLAPPLHGQLPAMRRPVRLQNQLRVVAVRQTCVPVCPDSSTPDV